jgi:hypothetical protein
VTVTTTYGGYTIIVSNAGFVVLDRYGRPIQTKHRLKSMSSARSLIRALRRAEREETAA